MGKQVTFKGNAITLSGDTVQEGQKAPDFTALNSKLEPVSLDTLANDIVLLNVVPSLDTPVCATQSKRFYDELKQSGRDQTIRLVTISADLPFAQSRFCGSEGLEMMTLSDHKDLSFAKAYGLLIENLRLLSRAVILIDQERVIRYVEVVDEVTNEPNYDAALQAIGELIQTGPPVGANV